MFQIKTLPNPTKKSSHSKFSKQITCKLFVGNLATHTTSTHLQAIFQSYGQIIECVKVRERYGFVRFSSNDQAQRALNACNGLQLNGYPMIVEYAQNEILISPKSPRVSTRYQSKKIPITNDDLPELKYSSSTLNPDASSFIIPCSTSDYYSQSERPSSRSSSERSNCLSPSVLSVTIPLSYSDDDEIFEEKHSQKSLQQQQQQHQPRQSVNVFIGDKILNLYGSNVDVNNNQTALTFDNRDIDPRDPIFIWNFAIYPDVSINPFIKRTDIKTLLERRVSLYS